ncbi:MAG: FHA domain-containing protein [Elusimicrobia bacterium]|nr:FHA domain-containing protein [Elusimicrobiota bacterium]
MPKLLLKFNMAVIKEIPIQEGVASVSVGRKEDNDIIIDNPAVSSHHARLVKHGNKFFVEDLNSTNGTFIAGRKILKAEVQHNMQIDIAKHSLVFIDDTPTGAATEQAPVGTSDQTVVIASTRQKELLEKMSAPEAYAPPKIEKVGCLRVVDGIVDKTEIEISGLVTYIGTDDAAVIKFQPAGGIFGGGAPKIAGLINKRPDGYIFKALKEGFPKVNGQPVKDHVILQDGNVIEVGKTKMVFFFKDKI